MKQHDVIRMAREADLDWHTGWTLDDEAPNRFETFAKLVAAHEREACAKVCEDIRNKYNGLGDSAEKVAVEWCLEKIRARGEQA